MATSERAIGVWRTPKVGKSDFLITLLSHMARGKFQKSILERKPSCP